MVLVIAVGIFNPLIHFTRVLYLKPLPWLQYWRIESVYCNCYYVVGLQKHQTYANIVIILFTNRL